jgi:hypothetical protein
LHGTSLAAGNAAGVTTRLAMEILFLALAGAGLAGVAGTLLLHACGAPARFKRR